MGEDLNNLTERLTSNVPVEELVRIAPTQPQIDGTVPQSTNKTNPSEILDKILELIQ